MLSGLMSRCTTPRSCAYSSASAISRTMRRTSSIGGRGARPSSVARLPPVDVRHHEVRDARPFTHVVDRHDVRMGQLRRRLRLAREPQPNGGVIRELRWQHLDRHRAVEAIVASAVDDGHAAATDFAFDMVLVAERSDGSVVERIAHSPRCVRGPIVTTSTLAGHTTSTPAPGPTFRSAIGLACHPEGAGAKRAASVAGANRRIAFPRGSFTGLGARAILRRSGSSG